ncbi:MAG: hypothetical protein V5804_07700 [Mucilaginibacter sp.]|uniref:hypothetical protein n=1 Tax=Mucilaginibacter sp. TaxID=1882438 RepID=UPI0034E45FF4
MNKFCLILSITAVFSYNIAKAQKANYNRNKLTLNGIPFTVSKKAIIKVLGKPLQQFKPHYECGFFSDNEQRGEVYYTLQYKLLNWIGNNKQGYTMENLFISPNLNYIIKYKGKILSYQTTQKEFMKLSGIDTFDTNIGGQNPSDLIKVIGNQNLKTTSLDLQEKGDDDKYIFYFLNGKLCKIEYWSPC